MFGNGNNNGYPGGSNQKWPSWYGRNPWGSPEQNGIPYEQMQNQPQMLSEVGQAYNSQSGIPNKQKRKEGIASALMGNSLMNMGSLTFVEIEDWQNPMPHICPNASNVQYLPTVMVSYFYSTNRKASIEEIQKGYVDHMGYATEYSREEVAFCCMCGKVFIQAI